MKSSLYVLQRDSALRRKECRIDKQLLAAASPKESAVVDIALLVVVIGLLSCRNSRTTVGSAGETFKIAA